jgi:hypothetical protein
MAFFSLEFEIQTTAIARSEATKQSMHQQDEDGLLRCARNDVVGVVIMPGQARP